MLSDLAARVGGLFEGMDAGTDALRLATGLRCPEGCGACCLSPAVDATVSEMLPLAFALHARGEADAWMGRLAAAGFGGPCVAYAPDPRDSRRGRCSVYEHRPSLCRLFGFAAVRDKEGTPALAACRVHREETPGVVGHATARIREGLDVPAFDTWASALNALDPHLGRERLPINAALARALERVGLWLELRAADAGAGGTPGEPPWMPPRRPLAA